MLELDLWADKFLFFPRRETLHDELFIILYNILKIAELDCCYIITRLDTCLISISRFSLRDKVTLRLLKLYFYIADVVEWSRALDIRLNDWCCSISMVWVQIQSREEKKLSTQRSNSNTVWFNSQTIYINWLMHEFHEKNNLGMSIKIYIHVLLNCSI